MQAWATVIAIEAKQSMLPLVEAWIASSRSLLAMTVTRQYRGRPRQIQ
jgi:hypothetical protein